MDTFSVFVVRHAINWLMFLQIHIRSLSYGVYTTALHNSWWRWWWWWWWWCSHSSHLHMFSYKLDNRWYLFVHHLFIFIWFVVQLEFPMLAYSRFNAVSVLWMAFNVPHSSAMHCAPCITNIYTLYNQMCVHAYVYMHGVVAIYLVSCLVAAKVIVPWLHTMRYTSIFRSFVSSLPFTLLSYASAIVPIHFLRSPRNIST